MLGEGGVIFHFACSKVRKTVKGGRKAALFVAHVTSLRIASTMLPPRNRNTE
jgi:hypothetical protein